MSADKCPKCVLRRLIAETHQVHRRLNNYEKAKLLFIERKWPPFLPLGEEKNSSWRYIYVGKPVVRKLYDDFNDILYTSTTQEGEYQFVPWRPDKKWSKRSQSRWWREWRRIDRADQEEYLDRVSRAITSFDTEISRESQRLREIAHERLLHERSIETTFQCHLCSKPYEPKQPWYLRFRTHRIGKKYKRRYRSFSNRKEGFSFPIPTEDLHTAHEDKQPEVPYWTRRRPKGWLQTRHRNYGDSPNNNWKQRRKTHWREAKTSFRLVSEIE